MTVDQIIKDADNNIIIYFSDFTIVMEYEESLNFCGKLLNTLIKND
jgi:hypothetical protein